MHNVEFDKRGNILLYSRTRAHEFNVDHFHCVCVIQYNQQQQHKIFREEGTNMKPNEHHPIKYTRDINEDFQRYD